tara:strand:+ start:909 stop:1496 length:588 start_codon:yes stop_codon:yes gene_type:complete
MRPRFVLPLAALFLIVPTNSCVRSDNVSNIVKNECKNKIVLNKIPGSIQVKSFCGDYSFKEEPLTRAIEVFVNEYSESFDIDSEIVWAYLHGLTIELSVIPRMVDAAYSVDGKYLEGEVPVSGLAYGPKRIWVEIKTSQVWSSSLIHELVHIVVWNKNAGIHGDPDHEGNQFSGWTSKHTMLIKRVNNILLDAEI